VPRIAIVLLATGCLAQLQSKIDPPASGGGTLTCREIAEQCDSQCSDPMCVRRCGDLGTADAARLHDAVVDCAQRNGCTDEACIQTSCGADADACRGPDPEYPPPGM
jgi:hypothetical protein